MTPQPAFLDHARRVADAILYEGYLLYPYRASAAKNRSRFQFGVLMPPAYREADSSEPSASQAECLLECPAGAEVRVIARFLHVERRTVEEADSAGGFREVASVTVAGTEVCGWDEASECEEQAAVPLASLLGGDAEIWFERAGSESTQPLTGSRGRSAGRLRWRREPLAGTIRLGAVRLPGPYGGFRLRVRVENHTRADAVPVSREDGLRRALIAAHALIWVPGGRFLSLTDPPEWAAGQAAACENIGTWPVLAGPPDCRELVLSSPVILYDHPRIAPESAGELFDGTEIDEILTLRTMALTDEEKREARATDPRAKALMDRLDHLPPEMLERMHGAIRYLGPTGPAGGQEPRRAAAPASGPPVSGPGHVHVPWWDPEADTSVSPSTDHIVTGGVRVSRGSRVRMRPGARRADAQDLFLTGRVAVVEAVLHDVDGNTYLAVVPEDDPAAQVQRSHGRFWFFAPDEVEPLDGPR